MGRGNGYRRRNRGSDSIHAENESDAYHARHVMGDRLMVKGMYEEAIRHYDAAIRMDSSIPYAHYVKGCAQESGTV